MIIRHTKGFKSAELVKQNKKTVWVKVENIVLVKNDKGEESSTVTYKTIKRKLKDIVSQ